MRPVNCVCPSAAMSRVLLPAPFGPTMTWIEPRATSSDTSVRIASRPRRMVSPARLRMGELSVSGVMPP